MKRISWILMAIACVLISSNCSQNPLDPVSDRQLQQIVFPFHEGDPDHPTIPAPMDLQLDTSGCIASLCWCTQSVEGTYACRVYRSVDDGVFELVYVSFCNGHCENLSELQFDKVSWFVTSVSARGAESPPSEIVSVKAPLPEEWFPVEQD
jgi:hypothetical protein